MDFFDNAADAIAEALPSWWATQDPASELSLLIAVVGELADKLATAAETIFADQSLTTASQDGLTYEWARRYGVQNEQLAPTLDTLRAYMLARAAEDGSLESLEDTLLSLLRNGLNVPDPQLGFLEFPADGSGLLFPVDGSGLQFPVADLFVIEHPSTHQLEVQVRGSLTFDRAAFARAVARFRPSHILPPTITEF